MEDSSDDLLLKFGLEAIDLRWTLKDIVAERWTLAPPKPEHVARLIDLGLIEVRVDGLPRLTPAGQKEVWR